MEQPETTGTEQKGCVLLCCEILLSWLLVVVLLFFSPFCALGILIVFLLAKMCSTNQRRHQVVVGIFSRSSRQDYAWLMDQLGSQAFKDTVKDIRPFYIANNAAATFLNEVDKCGFAILYHTKNRGRINITNVTDSLYDLELKHLSDSLGKQNVIVVIDDLDKYNIEDKFRILHEQPDIDSFAQELILVSKEEKRQRTIISDKSSQIKEIMTSGGGNMLPNPLEMVNFFPYLHSMVRWLVNSLLYICTFPVAITQQCFIIPFRKQSRSGSIDQPLLI